MPAYKEPRNTCPLIDEVIEYLKSIRDLEDICSRAVGNNINVLEEIRNHNATLRSMMQDYREEAEKVDNLEDEISDLKSDLRDANDEIKSLEKQVANLEYEVEKLENINEI